jgi:hypothetical protein
MALYWENMLTKKEVINFGKKGTSNIYPGRRGLKILNFKLVAQF